jgi:hypothetical protein
MTAQKISVAATAICRHVQCGGWIGASGAGFLPAVRRLTPQQEVAATKLASRRFEMATGRGFYAAMRSNFEFDSDYGNE